MRGAKSLKPWLESFDSQAVSTAPPFNATPAGWYADPEGRGQRYWDGANWTDQLAPPARELKPAVGDWIGAALLPLLMPIVGLIAGAIWTAMGGVKRQPGLLCLGLSALMTIVYTVAIAVNQ
jgi:hypothetical protein